MIITSHMIFKFKFLSLFSILGTHCNLIEDTRELVRGSPLPDLFPPDGEWLRGLNQPIREPRTLSERLKSIFRQNFFTETFESWSMDLRTLTPEKRLKIAENWYNNRDQVIFLDDFDMELTAINLAMKHTAKSDLVKELMREHTSRLKVNSIIEANAHLYKINEKLRIFIKLRFLELAKIDLASLNEKFVTWLISKETKESRDKASWIATNYMQQEIIEIIATRAWITFGNSIVIELKQLIHSHHLFVDASLYSFPKLADTFQTWWKDAFKAIDFLFKNKFADQETVRGFFQGSEMINQLIDYAEYFFYFKFNESLIVWARGSPYLTKHWYWKRFHECLKALNEKDKNMIDGYFLLKSRHNEMLEHKQDHNPPYPAPWEEFFEKFSETDQYLTFLRAIQDPRSYHNLYKDLELQSIAIKEVEKLITLIGYPAQPEALESHLSIRYLEIHLYYLLEFIENHISPGIINRISLHHPNFHAFDSKINLIRIEAKVDDLQAKAQQFHEFVKLENPYDWYKSRSFKLEFKNFLTELKKIHREFNEEKDRLKRKPEADTLETLIQIQETAGKIQDLKNEIKLNYDTFNPTD